LQKTFKISDLEVQPGKMKKQLIKIGEITDASDVNVPFIVVNGKRDGPVVALIGGEHGDEYCGQELVRRASLGVDPTDLSGAIIAIPNCNPLAYRDGTRQNLKVYDVGIGENINYATRDPLGNFNQRVSNLIWEEALSKADAIVNLHDGATHWIARYIGIFYTAEMKQLRERALSLAKAFGIGYPISNWTLPAFSGRHASLAEPAKRGIPLIIPEIGGMRMLWKSDMELGIKGIMNVMKHLKMIAGEPEPSRQIIFNEQVWVRCDRGGFLRPSFSPLDLPRTIKKGEALGTITNLLGDELEQLQSPADGVVFCARAHCAVHTGDWLYGVGK